MDSKTVTPNNIVLTINPKYQNSRNVKIKKEFYPQQPSNQVPQPPNQTRQAQVQSRTHLEPRRTIRKLTAEERTQRIKKFRAQFPKTKPQRCKQISNLQTQQKVMLGGITCLLLTLVTVPLTVSLVEPTSQNMPNIQSIFNLTIQNNNSLSHSLSQSSSHDIEYNPLLSQSQNDTITIVNPQENSQSDSQSNLPKLPSNQTPLTSNGTQLVPNISSNNVTLNSVTLNSTILNNATLNNATQHNTTLNSTILNNATQNNVLNGTQILSADTELESHIKQLIEYVMEHAESIIIVVSSIAVLLLLFAICRTILRNGSNSIQSGNQSNSNREYEMHNSFTRSQQMVY